LFAEVAPDGAVATFLADMERSYRTIIGGIDANRMFAQR